MTEKRIACLGDSNTYGFDPLSIPDKRYPPEDRWPNILAELTGWQVLNLGLNGRKIPRVSKRPDGTRRRIPRDQKSAEEVLDEIEKLQPLDLLVIMLGSNDIMDCLEPDYDPKEAAKRIALRMDCFLTELRTRMPELRVLLISPPRLFLLADLLDVVYRLSPLWHDVAKKHGAYFASACNWSIPLAG